VSDGIRTRNSPRTTTADLTPPPSSLHHTQGVTCRAAFAARVEEEQDRPDKRRTHQEPTFGGDQRRHPRTDVRGRAAQRGDPSGHRRLRVEQAAQDAHARGAIENAGVDRAAGLPDGQLPGLAAREQRDDLHGRGEHPRRGTGIGEKPRVAVADAGYWHHEQMDSLAAGGIAVLIRPDANKRKDAPPGWQGGRYEWMRRVLATVLGASGSTEKRSQTVEPMFGHTKQNRGMGRFHRRGRSAARTEWRLITATHNLLKLHSHALAAAEA
jgi:DDE family transposase